MTALKYAFVTLSLGTALAIPTAALAYNNNAHNSHSNHHEQDNHKHDHKHNHKDNDKHDRDNRDCDHDNGGGQGGDEPTPTPTPEATPEVTPEPTPEVTASDDNGVVLAAATTPATLPVTGSGDGLVFVIAGGSALATYLLMKRRSLV